ncbi:unnamed protein product [Spodoptera littoralis]|uniref:Uncharacterized protein n=2 Tax=Spodoptera TaxID=7106 RepID=A0A9P0N2P4_SPOLI|nr:unnamed protein product [Spodoptera littoralis]CAH1642466.1 unnamed protein product [Spodoptera littoralis]
MAHKADLMPYGILYQSTLNDDDRNDFQEVRCDKVFEAMRQCCIKFKPLDVSLVCEGYDLEPRKYAPVTDRPAK